VKEKADGHPILPCYAVSDVPAHTIVDLAINLGASHLILGAPRRNMLIKLIRGNMILQVSRFLPFDLKLVHGSLDIKKSCDCSIRFSSSLDSPFQADQGGNAY
jgi:hypothetical protein